MRHGSLFSGIGGFDLAAEWMGWENIFHCEWNPFGQKVLKHYWPNAISYEDITKTDFTIHRGHIDILTGGFPCQPYSMAGKRKGKEDERHLWPEMLRAIREIQPRWVVGENVFGLINWSGGLVFHEVQTDLEAEGYEVFPYVLPAVSVNAPHRRDRVWFVAYRNTQQRERQARGLQPESFNGSERQDATHTNSNGLNGSDSEHEVKPSEGGQYAQRDVEQVGGDAANSIDNRYNTGPGKAKKENRVPGVSGEAMESGKSNGTDISQDDADTCDKRLQGSEIGGGIGGIWTESNEQFAGFFRTGWQNFPTQSPVRSRDDGFSGELDGITFSKWRNESIKAYGNAVVPQVVCEIFKAIEQYEHNPTRSDLDTRTDHRRPA